MVVQSVSRSDYGLENHGIVNPHTVYWNLPTARLYEESIRRREGHLAHLGPLVVRTGQHTGRSANDKFTVKQAPSEENIWWGKVNKPFTNAQFDKIHQRMMSYIQGKDLFVQDLFAGADPRYRMSIRVITEYAWHSLFARTMFIIPRGEDLLKHTPEFTVIDIPSFDADPEEDGTNSRTFIMLNLEKRLVLIGGTLYAGEIKKSIFTVMNYVLPLKRTMTMHCSANIGKEGTAVFFGLSGTGKTTLSADESRTLIGDDEHGWSDDGVFNFEGGCYAKVIRLSREAEPEIYDTTRRFGTILENVGYDITNARVDLNDASLTENTRAAYPIGYIPNASETGLGGHPRNIVMLTADAFGVLPPISKLTYAQAMYHFLSGYTAKVAGTEKGVTEPSATFSACFGAPFMALHPAVYAELLGEKIKEHNVDVWLINTGWTGGPHGVGSRMKIAYTRAMVNAALDGALKDVAFETDPVFGLQIPVSVPNVPTEVLNPRNTWADQTAYDAQATKLAQMFHDNFKQYADRVTEEIAKAGPLAGA
ncbi:MAG TPA: phosphoenolpyruvate carboxykinase [Aggregatilineales bacterium]|jgi:phosphoenolpyruvate carboxykinase (ATP)|nr:phosphoenolpyruvate carboxykinase [Aggregatilineales bacterium]